MSSASEGRSDQPREPEGEGGVEGGDGMEVRRWRMSYLRGRVDVGHQLVVL